MPGQEIVSAPSIAFDQPYRQEVIHRPSDILGCEDLLRRQSRGRARRSSCERPRAHNADGRQRALGLGFCSRLEDDTPPADQPEPSRDMPEVIAAYAYVGVG